MDPQIGSTLSRALQKLTYQGLWKIEGGWAIVSVITDSTYDILLATEWLH